MEYQLIDLTAPTGMDYEEVTLFNLANNGDFEDDTNGYTELRSWPLEPISDSDTTLSLSTGEEYAGDTIEEDTATNNHFLMITTNGNYGPIGTEVFITLHPLYIPPTAYQNQFIYISADIKGTISDKDYLSIFPLPFFGPENSTRWYSYAKNPAYALIQAAGQFDEWTHISAVVVLPDDLEDVAVPHYELEPIIYLIRHQDSVAASEICIDNIRTFLLNEFYMALHPMPPLLPPPLPPPIDPPPIDPPAN